MNSQIISIKNLNVSLKKYPKIKIIEDVSFNVFKGKILGIVGESGSGKSITALSILNLLDSKTFLTSGSILYENLNLLTLSDKEMCKLRGFKISMVFQDPMTSLNPIMTIGDQLLECIDIHLKLKDSDRINKVIDTLSKVQIPNPTEIMKKYPFELSGGLRQRVTIALSICCDPEVIIADEPTTALDVTTQMEILDLLKSLSKTLNVAIIIITHDLGVTAEICDDIVNMYLGSILEKSDIVTFFDNPKHPYSIGLINSTPNNFINNRFLSIDGSVPSIDKKPTGCKFSSRCKEKTKACLESEPKLIEIQKNHYVRCFLYENERY